MTHAPLFITGGTGFLGRRVLRTLCARSVSDVRLLVRDPDALAREMQLPSSWQLVPGTLADVASWQSALEGVHTVLHLASSTGKVPRRVHHAVIVDGTESLVTAMREARVQRLLFVSSVAAGFSRLSGYPYAQAKFAAEQCVLASGLQTLILRPTLVFGEGSAVQEGLQRLAMLPVPLVFGDGGTLVQPVHVDDLAALLVLALSPDCSWSRETCTVGGPDVVSLEALLRRLRGASPTLRYLHLPIEPLRSLLALLEPALLPILPFTAGQLSTFANTGVATAPCAMLASLIAALPRPMRGLDAMLPPSPVASVTARVG